MESNEDDFFPLDRNGGYPTAIDNLQFPDIEVGAAPRTVLELELCKIAGAIRDRYKWWEKVFDKKIENNWREEAGGSENKDKFDYALAECKWQAVNYKGPVRPAAVDGVFAIDDVPTGILSRLLNGIERIRKRGPHDVHPGSNGLVIDIVHPSMYAYEQGVTPVLGGASVVKMPRWETFVMNNAAKVEVKSVVETVPRVYSKFGLQWLPAEFIVNKSAEEDRLVCEIRSYINSLHPVIHSEMYDVIRDAFVHCVPLLEEVLAELCNEKSSRVDDNYSWRGEEIYDMDEDEDEEMSDEEYWDRRGLKLPDVPVFKPPRLSKKESLVGKPLQVIVKIASIELTPEKPKYSGGIWHVEGMRNERIVATACMYVESENCTESRLEFRTACREPRYEQNDVRGVFAMYGLRDEEPLVQPRGVCRTLQGRALGWPNTLQHRVCPFELSDKSRAGRRTIVCFFLVDPTLRIRSTATVPPQCREWQEMAMEKLLPNALPKEVSAKITEKLNGLSFEDACERRARLMSERKQVLDEDDGEGKFFERPFSLCEH